jgi:hypothetical protein
LEIVRHKFINGEFKKKKNYHNLKSELDEELDKIKNEGNIEK